MKWLALVLTLGVAAVVGWLAAQPPAPLPVTAPATAFSAERAMADVRAMARAPHETGSAANEAVRAHLVQRLTELGFTVRETRVALPERARGRLRSWRSPTAETAVATNIIALRPGRDPAASAVAMMAHYDSVKDSPGAADDAAGVSAALEIARAIPRETQARDLVVLLTDGEEVGLVGARGFFGETGLGDPLAGRIGALVNMETRGGGGRAFMFETGAGNGALIDLYARVVEHPSTTSLAVKVYQLLPNSTDFTPAKKRGIIGYNIAFSGDARLYHSPLTTADAIDRGSIQHMGGQGLDLVRAMVTAGALPAAAPDVVFTDVLGLATIAWPAPVGWVLLVLAGAAIMLAGRARRGEWRWTGLAGGAFDGVAFAVVAGLLLYGFNRLSGFDGNQNYYDRLAALPRLEGQALLLVAAALVLVLALPRRRGLWDGWLGLAGLNLGLGVAVQALLPAGGPVVMLPLLLVAAAMLAATRTAVAGTVLAMLAAMVSIAWLGGFAHNVLLSIGADAPWVAAVFAPMLLLLLWPLLPLIMARRRLLLLALALVVAGGSVALWVRLDAPAVTMPDWPPRG